MMASIGSTSIASDNSHDPSLEVLISSLSNVLDDLSIASTTSSQAAPISKQHLSKLWCVSEELAQQAIDHNTHLCKHQGENELSRHYTTNDRMLRYKRLNSVFYSDTLMVLKTKSTRQNICCQLFVSDKGYVAVYPMRAQSEFNDALHCFCKEVGVPRSLIMDGRSAQINLQTKKFCH